MITDKLFFTKSTQIPFSSINNPAATQLTGLETAYGARLPTTRSAIRPENHFATKL